MNKGRKIFWLSAGSLGLMFFLVIVLHFSAARLINTDRVKEKMRVMLIEKTGADVTYDIPEFHLFPLPEIIFHHVKVSIPDKAEAFIESLRIYPSLWSLVRGDAWISKISLEAPHITVSITKKKEKLSLTLIEKKLRSIVRYAVTNMPGLIVTIREGKLDLKEAGERAFSFDLIQLRLSTLQKKVEIELACRSNLWGECTLSSSIEADDLKSEGAVRIAHLRPDILIARLSKAVAAQIEVSDGALSVKFDARGLRVVKASIESSVSGLAVFRERRRLALGDGNIGGNLSIDPATVSVQIKEAGISRPALQLSGQYDLDRNSGIMTVDLEAKAIAVQPVRNSALHLGGDIPLIETIFTYVRGGEILSLHVHTYGKSLAELGRTEHIRIAGRMRKGTIYVEAKDLTFQNVSGDTDISRGVLDAVNVAASLDKHRCSKGKLRIGLNGKDAPFHVDLRVKADAGQLPSLLKDKRLVTNEAVLNEMDRLHDLRGSVEGRLSLGDRLDAIHVKIAVSDMNITARYEPVPFPIAITRGQFFFNEKTVGIADAGGSIGGSSFSGLSARLSLAAPYDLDIPEGMLSISTDEIYPWITSFEEIKPVLNEVRSLRGVLAISSLNLQGPLYKPKAWQYRAAGEARGLTLDAAFLPGKAEDMTGTFVVTQNELSLKDVRSRLLDSLLTVSGMIREFPSDIRAIDLSLQGEVGQNVSAWVATSIKLPSEIKIRTPFSMTEATLSIEKDRKTAFDGRLLFGQETAVSVSVTKTPDAAEIRDLTVKDRRSDFSAGAKLTRQTIDMSFRGSVAPQTLATIFADSLFPDASLEGDFRTHIVLEHPLQSISQGRLTGKNIPVPWDREIPLVLRNFSIQAEEKRIVVKSAEIILGDMSLKGKGNFTRLPSWFSLDMDLSSNGIDWATFEKLVRKSGRAEEKKKTGLLKDLPVRGNVRLNSDFFQYLMFKWEPFVADISFDGKTVLITTKKAALCGISSTGTIGIRNEGLVVDIVLSAKDFEFRPTILCLTNEHIDYTGTFQTEAHLKGEGTIDDITSRLSGTFTLSAKDGMILKGRMLDKTFDRLNKSENLKGQFPDFDKEIISYKVLNVRGAIKGQKIEIEEGILDSSTIGILAHGHLDLRDETVDINALVTSLKTVSQIIRKIPILGYILGGNLVSVPVKISGKIKDPQVTFLSPSAIGSEALGIIERTANLPIKLVEPIFPGEKEK